MIISAVPITGLIRAFNLQNARVITMPPGNQYDGKIDKTSTADKALYLSTLGTPVLTDLTLGDPNNPSLNTYRDFNGITRTFTAMTFETVLISVAQPKRIITTEIQGRDGTVKEYIGMDDYQVTINGIITGPNGHFPIDEVNTLHQLNKAPIAIVAISTYLQNLDITNLVIKDFAYEQQPGAYSLQAFTLNCLSDVPIELQIQ